MESEDPPPCGSGGNTSPCIADSESCIREAQRVTRTGSWELNLITGHLHWSDEIYRIFEMDKSRFTPSYDLFLDAVHPDDRAIVDATYSASLRERKSYDVTHRIRLRDNRIKFVRERCDTTYDVHGRPVRSVGTVQDITELTRTEQQLRQFKTVLDNTLEAIFIVDADNYAISYFNEGAIRLTGYTREALAGMRIWQVRGDVNELRFERIAASLTLTGPAKTAYETVQIHRTGRIIPVESSMQFIPGEPAQFVIILRDISRRKRGLAAQRANDERYLRAVSGTRDGLWEWKLNSGELYLSPRWCEMLGFDDADLERHIDTLYALVYPADLPNFRAAIERHVDGSRTDVDGGFSEELRLRCGDGSYLWVHMRGQIYRNHAESSGVMTGFVSDINDRKLEEAKLQRHRAGLEEVVERRSSELRAQALRNEMIVNAAMDGYMSVATDGSIRDCNSALCKMLGYRKEELLDLSFFDIEANVDRDESLAHLQTVLHEGGDRFDSRLRSNQGKSVDVEISVALGEWDGKPHFFVFVHDISQRKQFEERLIASRDTAEKANAAKALFLSRMSHEFRTPLNAIIGFSKLMLADARTLPVQVADNLDEILGAGQSLLEMVEEILELNRVDITNGKVEALAWYPLANECIRELAALARVREVQLSVDMQEQKAQLLADYSALRNVLLNLLSNAIKYNVPGGKVVLFAEPCGGWLRLNVKDTGKGIPVDEYERIFHPFERLEPAYAGIHGTGIGLALARRLVEAMNGRMGVDSAIGEGSTFWIELPVAADVPVQSDDSAWISNKTILYIEDNLANRVLVRTILKQRAGIMLIEAATAEEGLHIATRECPDLILMDIKLPAVTGYEARKRLAMSEKTRDIPVIALTANAMPEEIQLGKSAGFADYLTKPIDITRFLETIERHLHTWSESP